MSHIKTKNEAGFTIVESMLQLVVLMLIIGTLPLIFPWYIKTSETILATNSAEYEVFLSELRKDISDAYFVRTPSRTSIEILKHNPDSETHLYMTNYQMINNQKISKSYYGVGTNIKLTRVRRCDFRVEDNFLVVDITFNTNIRKVTRLAYPKE